MRNANSNIRLVYLCVLSLFLSQTSQAEAARKVAENTDIEGLGTGGKSVADRHLVSTNIATELTNDPLSDVQTTKQQNTRNTSSFNANISSWSALESTESTVQENEAKAVLVVPEMSRTEELEVLDSEEAPIADPNRGGSSRSRSSSHARGGSGGGDGDDDVLSQTAIIAIVASISGVLFVLVLIMYCSSPYVGYKWRMWKAEQRRMKKAEQQMNAELKPVPAPDDAAPPVESSL